MNTTLTTCSLDKINLGYILVADEPNARISSCAVARAIALALQREGKLVITAHISPPPRQHPYKKAKANNSQFVTVDGFKYHIYQIHSQTHEDDHITVRSADGMFEHKISIGFLQVEQNV
ncbi:MAG: hypothetical protein KGO49_12740 [Gammaproteobacteria bacterium]|nr:hypothetical protein [Gammaproteobacteria bacterium]